jgi:AmmeMemoRadiSam system protein A
MPLSPHKRLLDIARETIRETLGAMRPSRDPSEIVDPLLQQPAGCFVSLHQLHTHRLRGCVGQIRCETTLNDSLRDAARGVLRDPRFTSDPVTLEELPELEIEVTVLSPMRAAASPLDFDPQNEGIWLTIGQRSGLFLPQVARDTGWSREQLLSRLCTEKLDMPSDAWKLPDAKLEVFTTEICGPAAFVS